MTAQAHEELIIDGEETSMAFCPPFPTEHPRIRTVPEEQIDQDQNEYLGTTACWRSYIGTWEIKEDRFYLKEIIGGFSLVGNDPIWAEWFLGVLRIPQGDILNYVHMGFGSLYERELHIRIDDGLVTGRRTITNQLDQDKNSNHPYDDLPGLENNFKGDDYWD